MGAPRRSRRPWMTGLGVALMLVSVPVFLLPGPFGLPVFAAGLILATRGSGRARLAWLRLRRRTPELGRQVDRLRRLVGRRRRRTPGR